MATSKQIKAYATANNCSNAEAKTHFIESATEETKANQIPCKLFAKKTDITSGLVEFVLGEVYISKTPLEDRNELIGCLGRHWLNDSWPLSIVAGYLSHSSSFAMRRMGIQAERSMCLGTGHIHEIDFDNLGCVIEFEVDAKGVGTQGPQWMSPSKVNKIASKMVKKYKNTHNIVGEVA
jgi:hypothetical protein